MLPQRTTRTVFRHTTPSTLRRTYAGIKQDDPSLHPTGTNAEAAKKLGPVGNSPPPPMSKHSDAKKSETKSGQKDPNGTEAEQQQGGDDGVMPKRRKTQAELDEDLRQKMAGYEGDGGGAGVEYEDGKAEGMRRGVRNNMFRLI